MPFKKMDPLFKLVATVVILFVAIILVWKLWESQIDVGKSARIVVGSVVDTVIPKLPESVAVRDPDSIYQNGEKVGAARGFSQEGGVFKFLSVANTQKLKFDQPFEFRRMRLLITHIEAQSGMKIGDGLVEEAVLDGVVCKLAPVN